MNILIVKLSSIGDVIHTLPVIDPLRNHFPQITITWLVEEKASDLLQGYPGLDRLIISKRPKWLKALGSTKWLPAVREIASFIKELRSQHYDLMLDFQGLFKSGVLVLLARGKRKVGFKNAREQSTLFYTEKTQVADLHTHAIQRNLSLLQSLGIPLTPPSFHLPFTSRDEEAVRNLLQQLRVSFERPIVAVHPGATWATKRWSPLHMAALCDQLRKNYSCQILLLGGTEEKDHLCSIADSMNEEALNLAGRTTLRELACILHKAQLVITTDSGPMHLACAVGTPVVALFGPTAPWRTGPYGPNNQVIQKDYLACCPCFKRTCPEGHHRCMQEITVAEVLEACKKYF